MANRTTSNQPGEISKPSPTPQPAPAPEPNTVKRTSGPTKPTDTTPTSDPLAEQPKPAPGTLDDNG